MGLVTRVDQDQVFISNFPLTKGFRVLVKDEGRIVDPAVIFVKGVRGWARATDKTKPDRGRYINFKVRARFWRHVYLLEQHLLSSGLVKSELADTHTSERVSIEHIAVLSGKLPTIEQELLELMRCCMRERIEHRRDDFKKDLATDVSGLVSDLTAWQPDDDGDRQQEIAHFARTIRACLRCAFDWCPCSKAVRPRRWCHSHQSLQRPKRISTFCSTQSNSRNSDMHAVKCSKNARRRATWPRGQLAACPWALTFDVVALGFCFSFSSLLFFISSKAYENFGLFFRAVVWDPKSV